MLKKLAVLVSTGLLLVACSSAPPRKALLRTNAAQSDGAGIGIGRLEEGSPVTYAAGDLCTTGKKPVQVTSVKIQDRRSGAVRLDGWGLQLDESGPTEYRKTVRQLKLTHRPVSTPCHSGQQTELDIQLRASTPTASVRSFRVFYEGGYIDTYLAVALCAPTVPSSRCSAILDKLD